MSTPQLVTVPNVELFEVGEDWSTSTGDFTFTVDDVLSAAAMQDAPGYVTPVIKFGHDFGVGDGMFSVGRVCNVRPSVDLQTCYGDYVGIPLWLARILPTAYPRRSIEGMWSSVNATMHGLGTRAGFYLTAVALLGAFYPAINTLADIEEFWMGDDPQMYDPETDTLMSLSSIVAARAEEPGLPKGVRVAAQASADDVRSAYYDSLNPAQMWWWIRTMYIDPPELIVDDDDGGTWRVSYSVGAQSDVSKQPTITFGEPQKCVVTYVDVAAGSGDTSKRPVAAAAWSSRQESRPATVSASDQSRGNMNREQLIASLGLAAGATDEQIQQVVTTAITSNPANPANPANPVNPAEPVNPSEPRNPANPGGEPPYGQPVPGAPVNDQAASGEGGAAPAGAPAGAPPGPAAGAPVRVPAGMALVDAATLAELRTMGEQGVAAAQRLANEDRDKAIGAAVKAGKFFPSQVQHFKDLWDRDPAGTRTALDAMADNIVPVSARSTQASDGAAGEGQPQQDNSYPDNWLPRGRQKVTA